MNLPASATTSPSASVNVIAGVSALFAMLKTRLEEEENGRLYWEFESVVESGQSRGCL